MENGMGLIRQLKYGKIRIDIDNDCRIYEATRGFFEISGFSPDDIKNGLYLCDLLKGSKSDFQKLYRNIIKNIERKNESLLSHGIFKKDGTKIIISSYTLLDYDPVLRRNLLTMTICDAISSRRTDSGIKFQNQRYKFFEKLSDEQLYLDYDVKSDIMHLPKKIFATVGKKYNFARYFASDTPRATIHPQDYDQYIEKWNSCLEKRESCIVEFRTKAFTKDGSYEWYRLPLSSSTDESGKVVSVFGKLHPISYEKMLTEKIDTNMQVIEKLSTTDHLTGLYNRKTFKTKAAKKLESFDESRCYAIIYSDINDFSYINDNFGFDEGNKVLQDFARLIQGESEDIISCRIYSDYYLTFIIAKNQDEIINAASYINYVFTDSMKEKYPASDIRISTGIYFFNKNGTRDVTIAIDNANLARRSVKGSKEVPCGIYSESLRKKRSHDQAIASELHAAIENGYIEMFLQPKFSLTTREIIGAEALARWRNADGSYKLPFEFVDVLEKVGYIVELDFCIYELVLKNMKKWKAEGKKLYPVSVNFSRLHTLRDNFVEKLINLADSYEIDKGLIEIEVTESAFAADPKTMSKNLSKLRDSGFKIDIDDFGIGYSSLSMLITAPVDTVKVDKLFVDNLSNSELDREYVKQICILIATTKKSVVFEGVETEEQAEFIKGWGFNVAQGWLFDKALSAEDFEKKYL